MAYVQGFLIPVTEGNRDAYLAMARKAVPVFHDGGATRVVECWGDDLPTGRITDMRRAVKAAQGETVAFSWIFWPDRATCDRAAEGMMADERMKPDGPMPFDGERMIWGGFDPAFDTGDGGNFGYVDGVVASVPESGRDAFLAHARDMAALFREKGAVRVVDGWGVDVPRGQHTDFAGAVRARDGEAIVFGWIEWPDKATRDSGMGALVEDARMHAGTPPWNGSLAIFGGFVPILDTGAEQGRR